MGVSKGFEGAALSLWDAAEPSANVPLQLCEEAAREGAEWNWPEGCDVAGLGAGAKSASLEEKPRNWSKCCRTRLSFDWAFGEAAAPGRVILLAPTNLCVQNREIASECPHGVG